MTLKTGAFTLTRDLALSPARLWHVITDATMRESWSLPGDGMVLTTARSDVRVGGSDLHRCGPEEAPDFEVETRWYRLDEPSDAVFTETILIGGGPIATSLVTCHIAASGAASTLHLNVAVSSFYDDGLPEIQQGWEAALSHLEAFAKKMDA